MTHTAAEDARPLPDRTSTFRHIDSGGDVLTMSFQAPDDTLNSPEALARVVERDGSVSRVVYLDGTSLRRLYDQLRELFDPS